MTGRGRNAAIFIGEPADVPDRRFGVLLPNRRRYAEGRIHFVGYVLGFDPAAVPDRAKLRRELGYGEGPLVVCTIGGTSVGRPLLELCGRAHPFAARRLPGLRTVLVCGPRIDPPRSTSLRVSRDPASFRNSTDISPRLISPSSRAAERRRLKSRRSVARLFISRSRDNRNRRSRSPGVWRASGRA